MGKWYENSLNYKPRGGCPFFICGCVAFSKSFRASLTHASGIFFSVSLRPFFKVKTHKKCGAFLFTQFTEFTMFPQLGDLSQTFNVQPLTFNNGKSQSYSPRLYLFLATARLSCFRVTVTAILWFFAFLASRKFIVQKAQKEGLPFLKTLVTSYSLRRYFLLIIEKMS